MAERSEEAESNLLVFNTRTAKQNNNSATRSKLPIPISTVSFTRQELNLMLRIYGFRVAKGEWRDYAIDMLKDRAVFSIYRRTSEVPLYAIEKNPQLARKQGAYSVINATGHILKRGHDLGQVLKLFEKKPKLVALNL